MFRVVADFQKSWEYETECTLKLFRALTDASLQQAITPQERTLGRIAWHIVTSVPEMMHRVGFQLSGPDEHAPMPAQAAAISADEEVAKSLAEQARPSRAGSHRSSARAQSDLPRPPPHERRRLRDSALLRP